MGTPWKGASTGSKKPGPVRRRHCRGHRWWCSTPNDVITTLFPEPDAYTQERALLERVLATVQAGELWIADRNFCTQPWLWDLKPRQAMGWVREHDPMRFDPLEAVRKIGRVDNGTVYEPRVRLQPVAGEVTGLVVRRIVVRLDQPTRHGDDTIDLLTTVPAELADACTLAQLYRIAIFHLTFYCCLLS